MIDKLDSTMSTYEHWHYIDQMLDTIEHYRCYKQLWEKQCAENSDLQIKINELQDQLDDMSLAYENASRERDRLEKIVSVYDDSEEGH